MKRPDQKSVTVGTRSLESLAAEWRDFRAPDRVGETIPFGWVNSEEYGQIKGGLSRAAARVQLEAGVKAGTVKRKVFRVSIGRSLRSVVYYLRKSV